MYSSCFNATSKTLQRVDIDLKSSIGLLASLINFVNSLRDSFDELELEVMSACGDSHYKESTSRGRKRTVPLEDSGSEEIVLNPREKFRTQSFVTMIDRLVVELNRRKMAYQDVSDSFKVIVDVSNLNSNDIQIETCKLAEQYPTDLCADVFPGEMIQLSCLAKARRCASPMPLAWLLHDVLLEETFPDVSVALRIYLLLMVSNCSGERSFSKMCLVKNKLRSTMRD